MGKVLGSGVTGSSVYLKIAYAERSRVSVGAGRQQEDPVGRERKFGGAAATADRFAGGWIQGQGGEVPIRTAGFQHHTGS